MAKSSGLNPNPSVIAELGPGDSLGIGLAALISGSDRYFAFDVVEHASISRNLAIFDELVALFKSKAPIPGETEWPKIKPLLPDYQFPADILDDRRLGQALESSRLEKIRHSIMNHRHEESTIQYKVPWHDAGVLEKESVDMIYSQAALEHVDDLENTYKAMYAWLKPTGYISHTIDFKCHGTAHQWNGHWRYSGLVWKLIRGGRPYLINRAPHSTHIALLEKEGFDVVFNKRTVANSLFSQNQLAPQFKSISDDDLITSETFVQGVKKFPGTTQSGVAT